MTMDAPPYEIAPLFLTERERLAELLAWLDPADWQRPSPCPGWTVLGILDRTRAIIGLPALALPRKEVAGGLAA